MSAETGDERRWEFDADAVGEALLWAVFGDRTGIAVFLAAVTFFAVYWRIGILSTDTYAVANAVVAASEGHLHVDRIVYGPTSGDTPGMHVVDGRLYARNYGMVVASLPVLWLLQGLALVIDLRIALVGGWCLGVLGLATLVGDAAGHRRRAVAIGSALALALFVGSVAVARPLAPDRLPILALQGITLVAAALVAVFVYRLVARIHGRRVGVAAAAATALASPVGFWATVPKRHSVTALLAVVAVYCFYRSRDAPTARLETRFRALAYAAVGLTAWVHAAEALVLLAALLPVDLLTARTNRPRALAIVAVVFVAALLPFFLTNAAIAGDPLEPPRMLPGYDGEPGVLADDPAERPAGDGGTPPSRGAGDGERVETGGSSGPATDEIVEPDGSNGGSGAATEGSIVARAISNAVSTATALAAAVASATTTAAGHIVLFADVVARSARGWTDSPEGLYHTFVRSGYLGTAPNQAAINWNHDGATDLSVLESMPIAGALIAIPALAVRRLRTVERPIVPRNAAVATDALAITYAVLLVTLYLHRLPLHHMFTVRYLHPVYPLAVYGVARLPAIRRVVAEHLPLLSGAYLGTTVVGGALYVATVVALDAVQSEAVQLFGICALTAATATGGWAVAATVRDDYARSGAVIVGVSAGLVTAYLLVGGLAVFAYTDEFLLPVGRAVAHALAPANPLRSLW